MVCMVVMNTMVLRAKPQDSYVSVNACGARVLLSTRIHKALVYTRILGLTSWTGINESRLRRSLNCNQAGTRAKLDMNQRMNSYIPLYRDE